MSSHNFLALDFGAESGRAELVTLSGGRVEMQEIHRFPNQPVLEGDTLAWDFPFLFSQIIESLKICADKNINLSAIGVDTWGVDFGLLDDKGRLLANPVHYRDSRTDNIHEYSDPIMSREEIFAETACEPWAISSLFQLLALKRDGSPLLKKAAHFLNMPDLFNFFLTGRMVSDRSIASTSNLLGTGGDWSRKVISRFDLPDIFGKLTDPGHTLGPLSDSVQKQTGLSAVPVITTCSHDTAAVVAAVPGSSVNWAFLSCGTWSILGTPRPSPVTSTQCLNNGFTNEYTLGGWFVCRNIIGLWIIRELCRGWDQGGDSWDYQRITREATAATGSALLDVSDESLMAPDDMEQALLKLIESSGQKNPASKGELARSVLESLACEYAWRLDMLAEITGEKSESLYIVGGGAANQLLCQMTANAVAIPVFAGAEECTAIGNALTQAHAVGLIESSDEIRKIVRASFELKKYDPENRKIWQDKINQYKSIANVK